MNIKSLLIGSAAALTVVSGANAADAIVAAEPEPLEYVRVCDAFGTGYFYIPGTETCLKIGGYMRVDFRGGNPGTLVAREHVAAGSDYRAVDSGLDSRARFMLNISTASDTEYGPLKTYSEVRFNANTGTDDGADKVALAFGSIDFAGFRAGIDESAFTTFTGYAGNVMADDIVPFGPYRTTLLSYSFNAGNGFNGVVSLEDDENASVTAYSFDGAGNLLDTRVQSRKNYAPNVAAGIGYTAGDFGARVVGGYDGEAEEGAVKARLDATFGSVTAFVMGGWSTDGGRVARYTAGNRAVGRHSVLGSNYYATWGGDWAAWAGFSVALSEQAKFNAQVSYDDAKNFASVANVNFTVVPGFVISPEVAYTKIDDKGLPKGAKDDVVSGRIRFQRSF